MQKKNWKFSQCPTFLPPPRYSQDLLCAFDLSSEKIIKDP